MFYKVKILFLKQASDAGCPFEIYDESVFLDKENFLSLFRWKAGSHYQFILSKNPEYKIIKDYKLYSYHKQWAKSFMDTVLQSLEWSTESSDINYSDYDVVITTNPFLSENIILENTKTLFVTFIEEHAFPDLYYIKNSYDAFINHTPPEERTKCPPKCLFAKDEILLPYYTDIAKIRSVFSDVDKKNKTVFFEGRTVDMLIQKYKSLDIVEQMMDRYGLKAKFKNFGGWDKETKTDNDSYKYWNSLFESEYAVSISNRLGQFFQDSASAKCVSIGICRRKDFLHEYGHLKQDAGIEEICQLIEKIEFDKNIKEKMIDYQDKKMTTNQQNFENIIQEKINTKLGTRI